MTTVVAVILASGTIHSLLFLDVSRFSSFAMVVFPLSFFRPRRPTTFWPDEQNRPSFLILVGGDFLVRSVQIVLHFRESD